MGAISAQVGFDTQTEVLGLANWRLAMHIGQVATIVIPVPDQDAALAFYGDSLGIQKVNDFTYPAGERWLEVSPAKGSSNLCLVASRPERALGDRDGRGAP